MGYQEGRKVKAIKSSLPSVPMPKVAQNRPDPGVALSDSFRASQAPAVFMVSLFSGPLDQFFYLGRLGNRPRQHLRQVSQLQWFLLPTMEFGVLFDETHL